MLLFGSTTSATRGESARHAKKRGSSRSGTALTARAGFAFVRSGFGRRFFRLLLFCFLAALGRGLDLVAGARDAGHAAERVAAAARVGDRERQRLRVVAELDADREVAGALVRLVALTATAATLEAAAAEAPSAEALAARRAPRQFVVARGAVDLLAEQHGAGRIEDRDLDLGVAVLAQQPAERRGRERTLDRPRARALVA